MFKRLEFLILFVFVACNIQPIDKDEDLYKNFVGEWMMIEFLGANCNGCPVMIFSSDRSGVFIKPTKDEFAFNYSVDSSSILLEFEESVVFFGEREELDYQFYKKEKSYHLELVSQQDSGRYVLATSKMVSSMDEN